MENINLTLTLDQVNVVIAALGKIPLEQSLEAFNSVTAQASQQLKQREAQATVEDK